MQHFSHQRLRTKVAELKKYSNYKNAQTMLEKKITETLESYLCKAVSVSYSPWNCTFFGQRALSQNPSSLTEVGKMSLSCRAVQKFSLI